MAVPYAGVMIDRDVKRDKRLISPARHPCAHNVPGEPKRFNEPDPPDLGDPNGIAPNLELIDGHVEAIEGFALFLEWVDRVVP